MLPSVQYEEVKNNTCFIDVRSPKEYKEGTIEGAVNVPLFTEEERRKIGTAYKQKSVEEARRLGVKFVSFKIVDLYDKIEELKKKNDNITAFCARGGYRSTFFANSFTSIGMKISKLYGGYKQYRKTVIEQTKKINEEVTYIVLHGNTGVGKTEILHILEEKGLDVLDLEGAANHRGSLMGSIGLGECNTQKTFESKIYHKFDNIKSQYVFVEAESRRIGKVVIPKYIHEKMKRGIHIYIDADVNHRISVLKDDYLLNNNWVDESIESVKRMKKYISKKKMNKLIKKLQDEDFDCVCKELMLNYYDPMYQHKSKTYDYALTLDNIKSSEYAANRIIKWYNEENRKDKSKS